MTNETQTVISADSVSKQFGRHLALDHVTFDVPKGCVFALLGRTEQVSRP